jgi:hypothetical protein
VVLTALGDFIGVEDMPVEWLDDEVIDFDVEIALQEIALQGVTTPEMSGIPSDMLEGAPDEVWACCGLRNQVADESMLTEKKNDQNKRIL